MYMTVLALASQPVRILMEELQRLQYRYTCIISSEILAYASYIANKFTTQLSHAR